MSKILAIDLGKNNSAVCIFDRSSLKSKFKTVKTRKQVLHDLFVEYQDDIDIVLFETGSQMGWVADILWALDIPFKVANTNHPAWKWKSNPNKSDRKDAQRLAMMYNSGFFPTVHVPKKDVRQKRSLINYRDDLVKRITKIKNSIRAILAREDIHLPGGKKGWTLKALDSIRKIAMNIKEITDLEDIWKGQLESELKGNKLLRTLLVEVSWLGLKEPWMRKIYDKVKRGNKKRSKVAIVALARQLLVRCWAILRDESCWDADHAKRFVKC